MPDTSRKTGAPDTPSTTQQPPAQRPAAHGGKTPQRRAEAHDDNALESIGKAVSEPVRDAADPDADERPDPDR